MRFQRMAADPYDLDRFVKAQAATYPTALSELRAGRKRTHWMWFIFPQLRGLGVSPTAQFYGLSGLSETIEYLDHPLLGPRLEAAVEALNEGPAASLADVFGSPDDLKFCSSMTLFAVAAPRSLYAAAIDRWCEGRRDARTFALLEPSGPR